MRQLAIVLAAFLSGAACVTAAGQAWVGGDDAPARRPEHHGWSEEHAPREATRAGAEPPAPRKAAMPATTAAEDDGPAVAIVDKGSGAGSASAAALPHGESFRNTYYDFPREDEGTADVALFDAHCQAIASVTRDFHDRVCVQGSGRLRSGETVSFAKRDCDCAATCPRTGQRICFERLDPTRFPSGRGATGKPITPLRTVAVDTSIIPLGTVLYIPEFVGLPLPDGTRHDGCFMAEDRGLKVVGRQIDVFTGDPALTARWNALVPSNRGIRVHAADARCVARARTP